MTKILGVILAGGRGERLGGAVKANLEIDNVSLVDRMVGVLAPQCDGLVLSVGQFAPDIISPKVPVHQISDPAGVSAGPVGGLAAAVAWARAQSPVPQFIVTGAVDTPFFPADFVSRAQELLGPDVDCVIGKEGQQAFPTNGLWRLSAILNLPERVKSPDAPHGLRAILPAQSTRYVAYPPNDPKGCFLNINRPEDLAACAKLAGAGEE